MDETLEQGCAFLLEVGGVSSMEACGEPPGLSEGTGAAEEPHAEIRRGYSEEPRTHACCSRIFSSMENKWRLSSRGTFGTILSVSTLDSLFSVWSWKQTALSSAL